MKIPGIAISLLMLLSNSSAVFAQMPAVSGNICAVDLGSKIDAIANRAEFSRSRWGILIQPLSSPITLYSRDSQKYFIPASNVKLLTTAAALQKLGADFRIKTSVYSGENGNLHIVGRGDPSMAETQLKSLAQQLKQRGISRVNELIGDDSYFQGDAVNPNWEWEDAQAGYGAPINSLIFNQNAIELILSPQAIGQSLKVTFAQPKPINPWQIQNNSVTVGQNESEFVEVGRDFAQPLLQVNGQLRVGAQSESAYVAVVNPANHFLQHFQQALAGEGIAVKQSLVASKSPNFTQELATVESPPLAELVKETNRESNNVYAEVLLRLLGKNTGKMPISQQQGTMEVGLKELKTTLTQLGVNPNSYILADGSGLSRHNLISPEALVQTLRLMTNSPAASIYRASLPVAGESGTLKNRFITPNRVILQAKTGTLSGVAALSGYVEVPNYEPLVFSIMVNQSDLSAPKVRSAIDEIVLLLNRLSRC
ncbi:D-alanyl-D-alanine carboxypeptidase/D-alanyl-D-alanine-endopeptidase [Tychonema sp. BBK16]|uniref:D-alanyl-D-alanine carboxypeptidase/D-alanyl-D-alanine endopeptidase n=1 Tax=Tychonema sp. BBK16 TaxID=2699888 RepID=UPI001F187452|nr:D-alanyl-D-alanine carboxypeptidase/D-alanyl-D-alanine-endopeptidase [Tychonema sp. BBK16]MCF6374828.1 D-alanyl-D-alanine carboxypeptidase/D-alanyl-D-alanine-endopeptidase [Tychonema sp. BBK16]